MKGNNYDVIIIGGGITGAGTARDCAMRGLRTLLVERYDFTSGATGRNHGLLHSGARYAVRDQEAARECIEENQILRSIGKSSIPSTDKFALWTYLRFASAKSCSCFNVYFGFSSDSTFSGTPVQA